MNALLLRNLGGLRRSSSLQSFAEYRQAEAQNPQMSSVTSEGTLLEYETLELRIHPPNVVIDNDTYDDTTVITIDSANRPGTLIEVVQCLTELGLSIRNARISSDGGWFVDEFFVTETPKGKLLDQRKMSIIRKVLSVDVDSAQAFKDKELCTVFELAGRDRHGLLAAVLQLLVVNGCEVLSAAVWTFHDRVALVISATERGAPVVDPVKLDRLEQILYDMLGGGDAVVNSELVRGQVHHERRLHHLLLLEELKAWEQQYLTSNTPPFGSAITSQSGLLAQIPTDIGAPQSLHSSFYSSGAPSLPDAALAAAPSSRLSVPGLSTGQAQLQPVTGLPPRAPSPSPFQASQAPAPAPSLSAEGSGPIGVPSSNGYTAAGFPTAEEGAACPHAASGSGSAIGGLSAAEHVSGGGFEACITAAHAAAPSGPYDPGSMLGLPPVAPHHSHHSMGRCGSSESPLVSLMPEPHIDVGLDLPAAVQLQDQQAGLVAAHAAFDRQLSNPGLEPTSSAGAAGQQPPSPTAAAGEAAAGPRHMERRISAGAMQAGASCAGAAAGPAVSRQTSARGILANMTVTGDDAGGQPPPAPTAAPPSYSSGGARPSSPAPAPTSAPPAQGADHLAQLRRSEVRIQHSTHLNYWLVTIMCRDRNKLFFDTVCTLADMNYDIYHATIDSEGESASQLFYVRPRYGECVWDERRAAKLRYMLESAVQRRFPRGTKVCVQTHDRSALVQLFSALSSGGFWITRADVRTYSDSAVFEFTITDTRGQLPEQAHVQRICEAVGGMLVADVMGPAGGPPTPGASRMPAGRGSSLAGQPAPGTFRFSILERRWNKNWGGSQGVSGGSYESSGSM